MGDDRLDILQAHEGSILVVPFQYRYFLVERGIAHGNLHQESVGLCFRQLIGALLFHGILRGDNGIDIPHAVGRAVDGHLPFLHHLKQGSLCLGGSAVDFVDQNDVGEHGALMEVERLCLHIEHRGTKHVARHEVGCELDAAEARVDEAGDEAGQQRLCHAGHTLYQHMAVGKDGGEHEVDGLGLSDDDAANALPQCSYLLSKLREVCSFLFHLSDVVCDFVHKVDEMRHSFLRYLLFIEV